MDISLLVKVYSYMSVRFISSMYHITDPSVFVNSGKNRIKPKPFFIGELI
jgi:hypothetical protein